MALMLTPTFSISADNNKTETDATVSSEKALREFRLNKILLIDVRSQEAYDKLHIPGSLNIPLFAVKTKPFLKTRPIILVNEGFSITPLETECRSLQAKGFHATVLAGGLIAWNAQKAPLEGDPRELATLRMVTADTFHQEKNRPGLVLVDAAKPEPAKPTQPINAIPLTTFVSTKQKRSPQPVLIFTGDGAGYDNIQYQLEKAGAGPAFFLSGGIQGYNSFLNNLALLHRPQEERTQSISACPSCAKKAKDDV